MSQPIHNTQCDSGHSFVDPPEGGWPNLTEPNAQGMVFNLRTPCPDCDKVFNKAVVRKDNQLYLPHHIRFTRPVRTEQEFIQTNQTPNEINQERPGNMNWLYGEDTNAPAQEVAPAEETPAPKRTRRTRKPKVTAPTAEDTAAQVDAIDQVLQDA